MELLVTVPGAPDITGTPAVSAGIGTALAEAVYISGGKLYHTRLIGMAWTDPALVGGADIRSVAITRSN